MGNWKRITVLSSLFGLAAMAQFLDHRPALRHSSLFPSAQAAEMASLEKLQATDHTLAIELRFEPNGVQLDRQSEAALGNLVRSPGPRVREYKVLVWRDAPEDASQTNGLADQRAAAILKALGNETPIALVKFAEREAGFPEAAVLAIEE